MIFAFLLNKFDKYTLINNDSKKHQKAIRFGGFLLNFQIRPLDSDSRGTAEPA